MIRGTGGTQNTEILATAARIAIIVFAAALALRQMGIAESIVNLAFGLLLGAVAVAAAIAFGIGGREVARDLLERWRGDLREARNRPAPPPPSTPPIPQTGASVITPPPTGYRPSPQAGRPADQPFEEPGSFSDRDDRPRDFEDSDDDKDNLPPV